MRALLFLTTGFEETEALATVDILKRGDVDIKTVSLTKGNLVKSSHEIAVGTDLMFSKVSNDLYDMLILPGGPGYENYLEHEEFLEFLKKHYDNNRYLAAICAAPVVFSELGFLEGREATCFPSFKSELKCGKILNDDVVVDENIITSKAMGTTFAFALKLVEIIQGPEVVFGIKKSICLI